MTKKSDTPAIRFKGFTDTWEQRKFSELYEKVSRKNDLTYGKDDIISVANMYFKEDSYITDIKFFETTCRNSFLSMKNIVTDFVPQYYLFHDRVHTVFEKDEAVL